LEDGTVGPVEKTSYAFRLVFQSKVETLTESIVQEKIDYILNLMRQKEGWEVR
jgi:phenylalanyl-tRNA synthetase beta subunit